MIEFKELRGTKDLAYHVRRAASVETWGGKSLKHLVNRSIMDNNFVTSYDYDIKAQIMILVLMALFYLKKIFFGK